MKVGFSVWAAAIFGSAVVANGQSRRGLAIENEYLVSLLTEEENCVKVKQAVDDLKKEYVGGAAFRGVPSNDIPVLKACTVAFSADEGMAAYVKEKLPAKLTEKGISQASEVVVEQDTVVEPFAPASWGLDRIDGGIDGQDFNYPFKGNGVDVYILDTGILATHTDFGTRATFARDFTGEGLVDGNGHGTHCAGTVGGTKYGVAKNAKLIGVKVLGARGGSNAMVIAGVNYAVAQGKAANKPVVISMSLGGGAATALDNAVTAAAQDNIVVVAAGNEAQNACNVSPARAGGRGPQGRVITVGATTRTDTQASYSNYGTCTDIYAPGSQITSAWIGNNNAERTISGTSMATPHVAGVAAVLLEKNNMNKAAAQAELLASVINNAVQNIGPGSPNKLLNLPAAGTPGTPPTPAPAPTPPPIPAREWTCPQAWYNTNDGCDCGCGDKDPDCDKPETTRLYCRGRGARFWQACNLDTNECVSIWGMLEADATPAPTYEENLPPKEGVENGVELPPPVVEKDEDLKAGGSTSAGGATLGVFAAIGGVCAVAAGVAFVVVKRRRAQNAGQQQQNAMAPQSYVASGNPYYGQPQSSQHGMPY